jgi:hypothetical protein
VSAALTCTSPADCAGKGGLPVACDGPEDCGTGQHCCMSMGPPLNPGCTSGSCSNGFALCHSTADCVAGENCCVTTTFGYDYGLCTSGACPR